MAAEGSGGLRQRRNYGTVPDAYVTSRGDVDFGDEDTERTSLLSGNGSTSGGAEGDEPAAVAGAGAGAAAAQGGGGGWTTFMWDLVSNVWFYLVPTFQAIADTFSRPAPYVLTPEQQESLNAFRASAQQPYDASNPEHEALLARLWELGGLRDEPYTRISALWKRLGFQGTDPATDFRGAGLYGLHNIVRLAERYPTVLPRLIGAHDDANHYPFAIAGLNLTMLLFDFLGWGFKPVDIAVPVRTAVLRLLLSQREYQQAVPAFPLEDGHVTPVNTDAFELLYCLVFLMLDREWTASQATYMEFPRVLETTRSRLSELVVSLGGETDIQAQIERLL